MILIKEKWKDPLVFFLIFYVITRMLIIFTPIALWEKKWSIPPAYDIINGLNPYLIIGRDYSLIYPPLQYLLVALNILIIGDSSISFALLNVIFDTVVILILYKIAPFFINEKQNYLIPCVFYAFFPILISHLAIGNNLFAPVFFCLAIFLYLKKLNFLTGFMIGLGFLVEIHPIFLLFLIGVKLLATRQIKSLFQFLTGFIISLLVILLPLFLYDLDQMLDPILINFQRRGTVLALQLFLPEFSLEILPGLSINAYSLFPIIGFLIFGLWYYHYCRLQTNLTTRSEFEIFLFFYLLLPLFFLNLLSSYLLWILPVLSLLFPISIENFKIKQFFILSTIIIGLQAICLNLALPNGLSNYLEYVSIGTYTWIYHAYLVFFLFLQVILWNFFWIKEIQRKYQVGVFDASYLILLFLVSNIIFFVEWLLWLINLTLNIEEIRWVIIGSTLLCVGFQVLELKKIFSAKISIKSKLI